MEENINQRMIKTILKVIPTGPFIIVATISAPSHRVIVSSRTDTPSTPRVNLQSRSFLMPQNT